MKNTTWKPVTAGVILIVSSALFILYLIAAAIGYKSWLSFVWLPAAIPGIIGGICAVKRRVWWLALIVSILSLPFGLPALILIALSKEEFKG